MSTIAAGTSSGTALVSTGNTDGTLQLQVNGTTPSITLAANGAIGVGSTPGYGTSGQVLTSAGTGSAPTWSAVSTDPGTHTVFLVSGNGFGSSSTRVRRFQTTVENTGTAITYADSASLGATFTINTTGMYAVSYTDKITGASNKYWAVTLNSTGLTVPPEDFPSNGITSQRLIQVEGDGSAVVPCAAVVFRATSGDVVRAQADSSMQDSNTDTIFCIRRVA